MGRSPAFPRGMWEWARGQRGLAGFSPLLSLFICVHLWLIQSFAFDAAASCSSVRPRQAEVAMEAPEGLVHGAVRSASVRVEDTMKRQNHITEAAIFLICDDELALPDLL